MLSPTQIENIAKKAAAFAARVLAMDYDYSIELINDPTIIEDGLFDPPTRTIKLNLAQLRPFSAENFVDRKYPRFLDRYFLAADLHHLSERLNHWEKPHHRQSHVVFPTHSFEDRMFR